MLFPPRRLQWPAAEASAAARATTTARWAACHTQFCCTTNPLLACHLPVLPANTTLPTVLLALLMASQIRANRGQQQALNKLCMLFAAAPQAAAAAGGGSGGSSKGDDNGKVSRLPHTVLLHHQPFVGLPPACAASKPNFVSHGDRVLVCIANQSESRPAAAPKPSVHAVCCCPPGGSSGRRRQRRQRQGRRRRQGEPPATHSSAAPPTLCWLATCLCCQPTQLCQPCCSRC